MPIYEYQGQQYDLPDGLTNDQAKAKIQAYLGGSKAAPTTTAPAPPVQDNKEEKALLREADTLANRLNSRR